MNIINIIDRIDRVNFGIWNAALLPCKVLSKVYDIKCFAIFPSLDDIPDTKSLYNVEPLIIQNTKKQYFSNILNQFSLSDTIVITHGSWRFPTRWGAFAAQRGFKWIYTPHGMLEPWGMKQKHLKKSLYFNLLEKPLAKKASLVRAVSFPEMLNLNKSFNNVVHIANGAEFNQCFTQVSKPIQILFLGRLNSKKCVVELLQAWINSKAYNNKDFFLKIIGPDDGDFAKLESIYKTLPNNANVFVSNQPVYGEQKQQLFAESEFFILPSFSEGFPTSIVEAGMAGCAIIYTDGCNFPELKKNNLGIKVDSTFDSLLNFFNNIDSLEISSNVRQSYADFFRSRYSIDVIANQLFNCCSKLLVE